MRNFSVVYYDHGRENPWCVCVSEVYAVNDVAFLVIINGRFKWVPISDCDLC